MRLSLAFAVATCVVVAAFASEPDTGRIDVALTDAAWQPLPYVIVQVFVGPDGRNWFQCLPPRESRPTLKSAEDHLAEEFAKDSPQVHIRPALFEPGGRVWFYLRSPSTLIGYDGKDWITHAIEDPLDQPVGRCLTRGGLIDAGANRSVGSTAWFLTTHGVYRFDGKTWSYQRIWEDKKGYGRGVKLSVSPDGKFAAALDDETQADPTISRCRHLNAPAGVDAPVRRGGVRRFDAAVRHDAAILAAGPELPVTHRVPLTWLPRLR